MPTEVFRAGDYRVCPSCGTRHKVQDLHCSRCRAVLAGAPVRHAARIAVAGATTRSGRGLRSVLAVGLVMALGAGLWVRSVFRGAALQQSVEASSVAATAPAPAPTWSPPVLSYPPIVGYNTGVPASMSALAIQPGMPASAESAAPNTGMMAIAPSSQPTGKTAFTNDDLERLRGQAATPPSAPITSAVSSAAGSAEPVRAPAVAATAPPSAAEDGEAAKWISRVHDGQDDVRDAQAKVRRLEVEAEARRAHASAVAADADAHDKAQRDVMDALDDLEKAERKLADKQRDLDEAMERARAAGVKFQPSSR